MRQPFESVYGRNGFAELQALTPSALLTLPETAVVSAIHVWPLQVLTEELVGRLTLVSPSIAWKRLLESLP